MSEENLQCASGTHSRLESGKASNGEKFSRCSSNEIYNSTDIHFVDEK